MNGVAVVYVDDWTKAYESAFCFREEWALVWRPVEYDVFKLLLSRFRQDIQRRIDEAQRRDDDRVREIVMRVRWYETHCKLSRRDAEEAAARDKGIRVEDVGDALIDASQRWLFE